MRLYLFIFLFVNYQAISQVVIEGQVRDEKQEYLSGISILIKKDAKGPVVAFSRTNTDGYYKVSLRGNVDSLSLFIQSLSYEEQIVKLSSDRTKYDFVLTPSSKQLEEVLVRPVVTRRSDTLSYNVDHFAEAGDRTLADVMKKIPGLEVSPSGKITYQGNAIEKYYIEGLDLLEGRYGLANNNLLAEKVDRVEVLENHQSIRMLDGQMQSNRTSLNIKLKNKYTTTVPVVAGAGVTPFIALAEFLPMVFSPKKQFIGGFKTNNIGKDISMDLVQHSSSLDYFTDNVGGVKTDIARVNPPAVEPSRYRFNESAYATVNNLNRIKKDLNLKFNVGYIYDKLNLESISRTTYNLHDAVIVLSEDNRTRQQNNKLILGVDLSENSSSKFFSNAIQVSVDHRDGQGDLFTNGFFLDQSAQSSLRSFSNNYRHLLKVGSQLVQVSSSIVYKSTPQSLRILNNGYVFPFSKNSEEVFQNVGDKKFNSDVMLQAYRKIAKFNYTLKIGVQLNRHRLESDLNIDKAGLYHNDLHWDENNVLFTQQIERSWHNLRFSLNLPLTYRSFKVQDITYDMSRKLNRLPFDPSLFLGYKTKKDWEFQSNLTRSYRFGTIENINLGFILSDYRSLNQRDVPLMENIQNSLSVTTKYNNPFKYINSWITARYALVERNLITSSRISDNGGMTLVVYDYPNSMKSKSLNGGFRYIITGFDVTLGVMAGWNNQASTIIMNDKLSNLNNNNLNVNFNWGLLLLKKVNFKVFHEITHTASQLQDANAIKVFNQKHSIDLKYPVSKKHLFFTKGEYYTFKVAKRNIETSFWDMGYRFTQKRIEVEASWQNILNANRFENVHISEFSEFYQSIRLRPTQFLVTFRWTFSP